LGLSGLMFAQRRCEKIRHRNSPDAAKALRNDEVKRSSAPQNGLLDADLSIFEINIVPTKSRTPPSKSQSKGHAKKSFTTLALQC